jgi:hypothetical protein
VYTKAQAHAKLTELGYRYNSALYVWELPNGEGGRLEWTADFCNPGAFDSGTSFQLRNHLGGVTEIPMESV